MRSKRNAVLHQQPVNNNTNQTQVAKKTRKERPTKKFRPGRPCGSARSIVIYRMYCHLSSRGNFYYMEFPWECVILLHQSLSRGGRGAVRWLVRKRDKLGWHDSRRTDLGLRAGWRQDKQPGLGEPVAGTTDCIDLCELYGERKISKYSIFYEMKVVSGDEKIRYEGRKVVGGGEGMRSFAENNLFVVFMCNHKRTEQELNE